jgi:hypothetical protein
VNIYYNRLSMDNAWLLGQTYNLAGGGILAPAVLPPGLFSIAMVPEPNVMLLVLFGTGAALHRRRRALMRMQRYPA